MSMGQFLYLLEILAGNPDKAWGKCVYTSLLIVFQNLTFCIAIYFHQCLNTAQLVGQNGASGHPGQVETFTQNTHIDVHLIVFCQCFHFV